MSDGNGAPKGHAPGAAALAALVLDAESRRRADPDAPDGDGHDLPGVGGDEVPLRSVLGDGRRALLVTVGAMWGLGFAIFSTTALLASHAEGPSRGGSGLARYPPGTRTQNLRIKRPSRRCR